MLCNPAKDCLFSSRNDSFGQMGRSFSFKSYQRTFVQPLRTARGVWAVREGFIVRVVEDSGVVRYGEVAPIPEFGTETVAQARDFLERLVVSPELAADAEALAGLPCCGFGVGGGEVERLGGLEVEGRGAVERFYSVAGLLPAGRAAVPVAVAKVARGYETFKWKIGVDSVSAEQAVFRELHALLPAGVRLRLDGNCGLSVEALECWLDFLQDYRERVDYIEQPLAVGKEALMARCASGSGVDVALDESLHGAAGGRWLEAGAWSGPLVLKPALMGDAGRLVELLRPVASQVVLSSVFETAVGLEGALLLADALSSLNRAIGFDTLDAFADSLGFLKPTLCISAVDRGVFSPEQLWKHLLLLI